MKILLIYLLKILNTNCGIKRKSIIVLALILLIGCKRKNTEKKRFNVVFITIDDLRPELGCYGNNIVKTPNIDRLAEEGTIFTNHFVQVPTCGASRYSLITGYRPRKLEQLSNDAIVNELTYGKEGPNSETFIHQFRRNGYRTIGIGKISHSPDGFVYGYEDQPSTIKELPYSWDEFLFDSGKWGTGWNAFFGYADGENRQGLNRQVRPYEKSSVNDDGYPDGLSANIAVAKLQELRKGNQPFFLGVGFFKPHLPFTAPKKYWDLYDRERMPLAEDSFIPKNINQNSLHDSPEFNGYKLTDEKAGLSKPLSDVYAKKLTHAYYASISYIDAQIGRILTQIRNLGLEDNTIVVVWGDHGLHLGNDLVWGKHTLFERSLKSPLIFKVPGVKSSSVKSIVETVDIYPTLLELCNIRQSHSVDGESLKSEMGNRGSLEEKVAYSYYYGGISMRTDRYRLTKYYNRLGMQSIELFDHYIDPNENYNTALDHPEIVENLLPLLNKGLRGDTEWLTISKKELIHAMRQDSLKPHIE